MPDKQIPVDKTGLVNVMSGYGNMDFSMPKKPENIPDVNDHRHQQWNGTPRGANKDDVAMKRAKALGCYATTKGQKKKRKKNEE